MAQSTSGNFTASGQNSSELQGSAGTISAGTGTLTMQLQIQHGSTWYDEGTAITQGESKAFELGASLKVRLQSSGTGTLTYAMTVR